MKIVDRLTFLALPAETLFSKYEPCVFGDLCIKGDSIKDIDFFYQTIVDAIACNDSNEFADKLLAAERTGESVSLDLDYQGRDGCFDAGQLFAVWEPADVAALIARLSKCTAGVALPAAPQPLADAARVLAGFAKTAPGRLPSRVQEAIAAVDADGVQGTVKEQPRPLSVDAEHALFQSWHASLRFREGLDKDSAWEGWQAAMTSVAAGVMGDAK